MEKCDERRKEQRLEYQWPVWFSESLGHALYQGQMCDISSSGVAFTCPDKKDSLCSDKELTVCFSVPRLHSDDNINTISFRRRGHICRIDRPGSDVRRIAVQFSEPLSFRPIDTVLSASGV